MFSLQLVIKAVCAHAGRIVCSRGCQQILSGMGVLVEQTVREGCIRLSPPDYPPGYGVSVTAGPDNSTDSQTETILPAAVGLLPEFHADHRVLKSHGRVDLVRAFTYREHKLWYFNQTFTAVLWSGVPADGAVDLKVYAWTKICMHQHLVSCYCKCCHDVLLLCSDELAVAACILHCCFTTNFLLLDQVEYCVCSEPTAYTV